MVDVASLIRKAVETGEVILGGERTIKGLKNGKIKMVIVSNNCPNEVKEDIRHYCSISGAKFREFNGDNHRLGAACGKPFAVSVLGIVNPGESKILEEEVEMG